MPKRMLTGLSFSISHLILARGWAEFHGMRMVVELDHSTIDDEYEEVILFYAGWSFQRSGMIWRCSGHFAVQQPFGQEDRFDDILEALDSLVATSGPEILKSRDGSADNPRLPSPTPGTPRPARHSSRAHRAPPPDAP